MEFYSLCYGYPVADGRQSFLFVYFLGDFFQYYFSQDKNPFEVVIILSGDKLLALFHA